MLPIQINHVLKLISPVCLSVNHYMKPRPFIAHGKPAVTMYEAAEAKKYKRDFALYVKNEANKQNFKPLNDEKKHYYCDCVFYFARKDKDANNYFKLLLDAITESGVVWKDDNVVCERVQAIYYDKENPRIEITIRPVDYIGVFNSQEQLDKFAANCVCCSRYRNGRCSILINATEGVISDDFTLNNGVNCIKRGC